MPSISVIIIARNTWTHWESDSEASLPPCLKGHSAVLLERNMYIFGGYEDILGSSELMWSFDISMIYLYDIIIYGNIITILLYCFIKSLLTLRNILS